VYCLETQVYISLFLLRCFIFLFFSCVVLYFSFSLALFYISLFLLRCVIFLFFSCVVIYISFSLALLYISLFLLCVVLYFNFSLALFYISHFLLRCSDTLYHLLVGEKAAQRRECLRDLHRPLSRESEMKAWMFLEARCQILVRSYGNSIGVSIHPPLFRFCFHPRSPLDHRALTFVELTLI